MGVKHIVFLLYRDRCVSPQSPLQGPARQYNAVDHALPAIGNGCNSQCELGLLGPFHSVSGVRTDEERA